jgi:hypothetical protein
MALFTANQSILLLPNHLIESKAKHLDNDCKQSKSRLTGDGVGFGGPLATGTVVLQH